MTSTAKQLEIMPLDTIAACSPAKDPLWNGLYRHDRDAEQRKMASLRRIAELDERLRQEPLDTEKMWRKQIRQRKVEEQRKKAEEEAAAIAAAAEAAAQQKAEEARLAALPPPAGSVEAARLLWAENAAASVEAEKQVYLDFREQEKEWLKAEWEPQLARRKQEAREKRLEHERLLHEAEEAEVRRFQRETQAMLREDNNSAAFEAFADSECERLAQKASTAYWQQMALDKAEVVLEWHGSKIRWKESCRLQHEKEEEARRHLEAERKERDYRDWKEQIRQDRCKTQRLKDRKAALEQQAFEMRRLELQGRDILREREHQQKEALELAIREADKQSTSMRERGVSPRRALEQARLMAEEERKLREEREPVKAEQELWDALLAKNRLAKTQERKSGQTPRWGMFTS
eukprot:TRINITY_DN9847_c1_g1_i1.p1 TRINITY_DN9847_c1_g1~~TRINITY_DN9847_c1_g1_i1.p1  ORF type:complete len:460 (-),score=129.97 TRINITY_DN9847_c1_g1_i1:103-1317(-)